MFRAKLKLNERTEVDLECGLLRKKAERSRLSNAAVESLIDDFTRAVEPLIESGRLMHSQGSSFNATRSIKGSGYEVQLEFATGNNQSFLARLRSLILGH